MAALAAGTVVLVRFPFTDLSRAVLRPALVLARNSYEDVILCQITSNAHADPHAVELNRDDFGEGSLHRTSYARPGKLFTAHRTLIARSVGSLHSATHNAVLERVVGILRRGAP